MRHGWSEGLDLILEDEANGISLRPATKLPETTLQDLVGCAGYQGPRQSLEEMEAAIAKGAREHR